MSVTDPAVVAAYQRAFARLGVTVSVTFTRVSGFPPNVVTSSATVNAVVRNYNPDTTSASQTGYASTKIGGMTEGDRTVIVMASDLVAADFPVPVQKNDTITLVDTGEILNVIAVDAFKRNIGGAIEIRASGVT